MISNTAGYKIPIVLDRFAPAARTAFTSTAVLDLLARTGSATGKTLEEVRAKLQRQIDKCGVLPQYWLGAPRPDDVGDPTPGEAGRERAVENFINEMISDFNAAHPELALR